MKRDVYDDMIDAMSDELSVGNCTAEEMERMKKYARQVFTALADSEQEEAAFGLCVNIVLLLNSFPPDKKHEMAVRMRAFIGAAGETEPVQ